MAKVTNVGQQEWHPNSLAETNRAAHDLAGHLKGALDWFDALRAADRNEPPDPLPHWWEGYMKDHDWLMLYRDDRGPATPEGRLRYLRRKVELHIHRLTSDKDGIWSKLVDPIPIGADDRYLYAACKESLRNLDGLLGPGGLRKVYGVIPDERHLASKIPGVWDPESKTSGEALAEKRLYRAMWAFDKASPDQKKTFERRLAIAKGVRNRLRNARDARNEAGAKNARKLGLVDSETLKRELFERESTKEDIKRWRLGEADVRRLLTFLISAPSVAKKAGNAGVGAVLRRPIPIAKAAQQLNLRTDTLTKSLERRGYGVVGAKRAYAAELEHILMLVTKGKKAFRDWADREYPE